MSHSVVVNLIADQTLFIRGQEINIHDLESITLDAGGCIIAFRLKALGSDKGTIHKMDLGGEREDSQWLRKNQ